MKDSTRFLYISVVIVFSSILGGCSSSTTKLTHSDTQTSKSYQQNTTLNQDDNDNPVDHYRLEDTEKVLRASGLKFGVMPDISYISKYGYGLVSGLWYVLVNEENGTIDNDFAKKVWSELWAIREPKIKALQVRICWTNHIDNNPYSISVSNIGGPLHGTNYYTGENFN